MYLCIDFVQEDGTSVPDVILRAHTREGLTHALSVDLAHTASDAFADATLATWESDWNPEGFSFLVPNGNDTQVRFTYVP